MKKYITAVIVYRNDDGEIDNGIFPKTVRGSYNEEKQTAVVRAIYGYDFDLMVVRNITEFIPFVVSGRTYQERKANLRETAIQWSNAETAENWSYGEIAEISDFFRTNGKRYGLLKEFEENCIC